MTLGGRFYYDAVDRVAALGNTGNSREGDSRITSDEDLTTLAFAGYVQNEFKLTNRLSVVPGVRYEHIEQTRRDVLANRPEQAVDFNIWVPGLGLKYAFASQSQVYANVSRSFRPPNFGDSFNPAISASSTDLDSSTAWTYEAGVRVNPYPWLMVDAGGFYTDFKDQVVVSAGTAANFDTTTYGFEATSEVGLFGLAQAMREGDLFYAGDHEVFLSAGATLVDSTFANGAFAGKDLPYVPNETITFGIRYAYRDRFDLIFQGRYIGDRFTDNANTVAANQNATIGELSEYVVMDVKARWHAKEWLTVSAGINNLFDETYETQRRTSQQKGVFPGPTRAAYVAATFTF